MTDPLALETYDYHLPEELIAQHPCQPRENSRLLRLDRSSGVIEHLSFRQIVDLVHPDDVLVLNDSRVIPARLFAHKDSGSQVELLLLHELSPGVWQCMMRPGKKVKEPQWLKVSDTMRAHVSLSDEDGLRQVRFETDGDFWQELEKVGHIPLPPYIKREDQLQDRNSYQTVYANQLGSAAAPTAGLHFSPQIISALQEKGVHIVKLTLHVGMGTFLPVKSQRIDQHKMHAEYCTIDPQSAATINQARSAGRRIIAVGSTSARTLESFYNGKEIAAGSRWTDIFIYPGKTMQVVDAMITNFHLPKSSLLMMISAFAGIDNVRRAYEEAVRLRYRFFSYGDAMLIE